MIVINSLRILLLLSLVGLSGCAVHGPAKTVPAAAPSQWHAPVPHQGQLSTLQHWWAQLDDPLLVRLIEATQKLSPTVAAARTRIEQARLTRVTAGAALLPSVDASLQASKTSPQPPFMPENTTYTVSAQTAWEIDLFGAKRAGYRSAEMRLRGAEAGWHEARVAVAAEVANSYYNLRACELSLAIVRADAVSRQETARLSDLSAQAGFLAPANAALARASAAEGQARVAQQQASCDLEIKTLVALTALPEPELRSQLAQVPARLPEANLEIATLPAQVLAQRPDVYRAEREVEAASDDIAGAHAQRFPRLTLNGSIGATRFVAGNVSSDSTTWSIGPVALTVPLWDAGKSRANVDAARARYEEAVVNYQNAVRNAVREVEQALVRLQSTAARGQYVIDAVEGFRASLGGTESLYQNGLASLYQLEESRRTRLTAELAVVSLRQERIAAWIALYRAAGGGWDATQREIPPLSPQSEPSMHTRSSVYRP